MLIGYCLLVHVLHILIPYQHTSTHATHSYTLTYPYTGGCGGLRAGRYGGFRDAEERADAGCALLDIHTLYRAVQHIETAYGVGIGCHRSGMVWYGMGIWCMLTIL